MVDDDTNCWSTFTSSDEENDDDDDDDDVDGELDEEDEDDGEGLEGALWHGYSTLCLHHKESFEGCERGTTC